MADSGFRNDPTEQDPLLSDDDGGHRRRTEPININTTRTRHRWVAHPFWLIPVVLVMSMSSNKNWLCLQRGLTMSPRIQVYKAIACRMLTRDAGPNASFGQRCDDLAVQARAAKIQASVVTIMSILSALSTGFWSKLGDTRGRKLILSTFLIGALSMEAVFMLVMRPESFFGRRAERVILVGPVIEGLTGGLSTFNGVVHAYISDCTQHGSRSTIFSTVQGMIFVGLAIGPWIGGFLFPAKGYNDGFFIGSISLIGAILLYIIFICPESRIRIRGEESVIECQQRQRSDEGTPSFNSKPLLAVRALAIKLITALLLPVTMFAPRRVPGSRQRNWNMTLCGLGIHLYVVSTGIHAIKYLYAQHVYDWTTAQLGYYMSTLWVTRAINLLIFLPIVIPFLKPRFKSSRGPNTNAKHISSEMNFDRFLAGTSLALDGLADTLIAAVANKLEGAFIGLSCLSSFTSGGNPALHSLAAVCLHASGRGTEVGALFGAIGVVSAVSHIISPYIYALTYGSSVGIYAEAVFVLAGCLLFLAVFCLSGISPAEKKIVSVVDGQETESLDVDIES